MIRKILQKFSIDIRRYDKRLDAYHSLYFKYKDFTMINSGAFVSNVELVKRFDRIAGDYVECGVWRGGMSAAIAEVGIDRKFHLFDSFEGLPAAKEIDGKEALAWQGDSTGENFFDNCKAEESYVIRAMAMAKHTNYQLYKGWFQNTLNSFSGDSIAILRLDGDWYDSIMECLVHLYPKVATGGLILLDDYHTWSGCSRAVHDYLSQAKSTSRISELNRVAYIIKK